MRYLFFPFICGAVALKYQYKSVALLHWISSEATPVDALFPSIVFPIWMHALVKNICSLPRNARRQAFDGLA